MKRFTVMILGFVSAVAATAQTTELADYLSPLAGTLSKVSLSAGNTYPAIETPRQMNFRTQQTGKTGNGRAYTCAAGKIHGFKQTRRTSPRINDYGQFSIIPVSGKAVFEI